MSWGEIAKPASLVVPTIVNSTFLKPGDGLAIVSMSPWTQGPPHRGGAHLTKKDIFDALKNNSENLHH